MKPASGPAATVKLPELSREKSVAVVLRAKKTSSPLRRGSVEMLPYVPSVTLEPVPEMRMLKVGIGAREVVVKVVVP